MAILRYTHTSLTFIWCVSVQPLLGYFPSYCLYRSMILSMFWVIRGERPTNPSLYSNLELSDEIWEVMTECWSRDPNERPTVGEVAQQPSALPTKLTAESFCRALKAKPPTERRRLRCPSELLCVVIFFKDEIDPVQAAGRRPRRLGLQMPH